MTNQVAIVTGGGGNLGVGVCRALAKAGFTVAVLDVDPSRAEAADRRITCDVRDPAACAAAVDEVVGAYGAVDALVNAAQGIRLGTPLIDVSDDDMEVSFATGPTATLRMMQLCYPHLQARRGGSIVNFASGAGTHGLIEHGAYAAAKEAIRGLTKVAAMEWAADNIRVNAICPVATSDPDVGWAAKARPLIPLGRLGDAEADVGSAVVFLARPDGYITGRTLHVDGGVGVFR